MRSQDCVDQAPSTSDKFFYKLKHKYECLSNPKSEFPTVSLPDEVYECLNIFYDYRVQVCLESYEEAYGSENIGFYEKRSVQWYGNLT